MDNQPNPLKIAFLATSLLVLSLAWACASPPEESAPNAREVATSAAR